MDFRSPKTIKYCLILWCLFFCTPSVSAQLLIVHPDNDDIELSRTAVRAIFSMRTRSWPDGSTITVFVLEDDAPAHSSFCKNILGMFPYQQRRIWDRQIFSGTGIAPITVKTVDEMHDRVAQTKGSVGYLDSTLVDTKVKSVEVLR